MCPIHVLAFMSQHPFISQDPLQDPCLRSLSIFVSQDSLQDPCLRIHVSASTNMDPLQDPRLWAHISASLYLRLLCKIHVSGSVYKHPYVSQDPLQDPCPRIHVSASICISGSSARSMSPDPYIRPCLRIHVSASSNLKILCKIHVSDSCLSIHVSASLYLRILCKIHVSDSCLSILSIRFCAPAQAKRKFWPPETRFVWPCAGKTVRPSVSRRRNANFELPRCIFCGPGQAKRKFWPPETHLLSRWSGFTRSHNRMNKIATALQRDAKKISQPQLGAGETQILTSGVAFSVALRSKKRGAQKKAPRPKRLYPYRKNPSVWHTVWGKKQWNAKEHVVGLFF